MDKLVVPHAKVNPAFTHALAPLTAFAFLANPQDYPFVGQQAQIGTRLAALSDPRANPAANAAWTTMERGQPTVDSRNLVPSHNIPRPAPSVGQPAGPLPPWVGGSGGPAPQGPAPASHPAQARSPEEIMAAISAMDPTAFTGPPPLAGPAGQIDPGIPALDGQLAQSQPTVPNQVFSSNPGMMPQIQAPPANLSVPIGSQGELQPPSPQAGITLNPNSMSPVFSSGQQLAGLPAFARSLSHPRLTIGRPLVGPQSPSQPAAPQVPTIASLDDSLQGFGQNSAFSRMPTGLIPYPPPSLPSAPQPSAPASIPPSPPTTKPDLGAVIPAQFKDNLISAAMKVALARKASNVPAAV